MVWIVLPKPISSASMPPVPCWANAGRERRKEAECVMWEAGHPCERANWGCE